MAAYSYGSSYESVMKKSCGYRQLGNYYNKLFDNVTTDQQDQQNTNKIVVTPEFGQPGYNRPKDNRNNGDNDGQKCNTWRSGQCSDGRSLSKDAYTQCMDGHCAYYKDMKAPASQLYSRY
jgi:hypothetical protein